MFTELMASGSGGGGETDEFKNSEVVQQSNTYVSTFTATFKVPSGVKRVLVIGSHYSTASSQSQITITGGTATLILAQNEKGGAGISPLYIYNVEVTGSVISFTHNYGSNTMHSFCVFLY